MAVTSISSAAPSPARARSLRHSNTVRKPVVIDDHAIRKALMAAGEALIKQGKQTRTATLVRQLGRRHAHVADALMPVRRAADRANFRSAVVVLGTLYRCGRCERWHLGISTGFMIGDKGACVTNHHVVDRPETETLLAMTADGRIHPVREVLAADPLHDLAIIRLEGSGFTRLPLGRDPGAGTPVRVLSHPDGRFYTLTTGVVSRTFAAHRKLGKATVVEITADFAKGSSGAPVVDASGAVVAVAANTHSIYYEEHKHDSGGAKKLQMVLKRSSPVSALRRLLTGAAGDRTAALAHKPSLVSRVRAR